MTEDRADGLARALADRLPPGYTISVQLIQKSGNYRVVITDDSGVQKPIAIYNGRELIKGVA